MAGAEAFLRGPIEVKTFHEPIPGIVEIDEKNEVTVRFTDKRLAENMAAFVKDGLPLGMSVEIVGFPASQTSLKF